MNKFLGTNASMPASFQFGGIFVRHRDMRPGVQIERRLKIVIPSTQFSDLVENSRLFGFTVFVMNNVRRARGVDILRFTQKTPKSAKHTRRFLMADRRQIPPCLFTV